MVLTDAETWGVIGVVAAGTVITRFLPFLLFGRGGDASPFMLFLGRVLPPAMMGLLVVYCFKGVGWTGGTRGLPEVLAAAATVLLHLWRRNLFLSIGVGTAAYMLLLRLASAS